MNRTCMNTVPSALAEWLEPKVATRALFMLCSDFHVPTNKLSHLLTCVLHSHMFNTPTSSLLPTNSFSSSIKVHIISEIYILCYPVNCV
jgi:hypothetical protein